MIAPPCNRAAEAIRKKEGAPQTLTQEDACDLLLRATRTCQRDSTYMLKVSPAGAAQVAQRFSGAFGPGRDPGDPGLNRTSGSWCMEPASPSACVSASLSLSLFDYYK